MRDDERDAAIKAHLEALDAEIARLRKLEQAMDRRLARGDAAEEHPDGGEQPAPEPPAEDD